MVCSLKAGVKLSQVMSKKKAVPPANEEPKIHYYHTESELRYLAGRVLIIIDASVTDSRQNKAMKDMVKEEIRKLLFRFQEVQWGGDKAQPVSLPEDSM
jgi:dynactin complex subunit